MAFPDLPWRLKGEGPMFCMSYLVRMEEVADIIPEQLRD